MLKLNAAPFWLDLLPGVRVKFRPVSTPAYILSRQAAHEAMAAHVLEHGEDDEIGARVAAQVAFTTTLARRGIKAWEGVGDADGAPIEPTPDAVTQLLNHYAAFEAIDRLYVGPVLEAEAEKKRIVALADWVFRDGESYCRGCREHRPGADPCDGCPLEINQPQTDDGLLAWHVLSGCRWQLRTGMSGNAYGLDFTAVTAVATAMGAMTPLLADLLPDVERVLVQALRSDDAPEPPET